ncbi:MAG TPA: TadE/TadG family type IV pilus assembly protein [Allosphingosinicella sp.]|jgi:Flp pilus assembly pilin Flp
MRGRSPFLARDERGATIIEFGMIAPVLALFVMGIIDLSRGLSERFTLEQAVNRTLELVQSRNASPAVQEEGDTPEDAYQFAVDEAETAAGPGAVVTPTLWRECDGVETAPFNENCEDNADGTPKDTARYLKIHITKNFQGEYFLGARTMAASGSVRIP